MISAIHLLSHVLNTFPKKIQEDLNRFHELQNVILKYQTELQLLDQHNTKNLKKKILLMSACFPKTGFYICIPTFINGKTVLATSSGLK